MGGSSSSVAQPMGGGAMGPNVNGMPGVGLGGIQATAGTSVPGEGVWAWVGGWVSVCVCVCGFGCGYG